MNVVIFVIILVLLLLFIKEVIEPLHSLIYVMFFFVTLSLLLSSVVLPFANKLLDLLPNMPYSRPLVFSAVLYLIGEQMKQLFEELEYESLGTMLQLAIRLIILMYWLGQLDSILDELKPFIQWLQ